MTEPKRLFDCLQYHLERTPLDVMLAAKENSQWRKYSTQEVKDTVDKLSAGLLNLGIGCGDMTAEGRDKVAILCKNRPEWIMLDLAVQQIGAILIPIYPTININELEFVLKDAQVKIAFVNDEELFLKVLSLKEKLTDLKEIYTFEHVANAKHWKELLNQEATHFTAQIKTISDKIHYEDLATII
ncbi:MAG: AMP-binding protein, partial [Bacteroidia bacterium]|nr:AMP-binding protein [Bacteroidia bacterium]